MGIINAIPLIVEICIMRSVLIICLDFTHGIRNGVEYHVCYAAKTWKREQVESVVLRGISSNINREFGFHFFQMFSFHVTTRQILHVSLLPVIR